jgi:hypothetical protein
MTHTERLTERAITFAIAEANEDLAVARLAFLANGDHAALDAAIDACLARTKRTLYTRWRAISFLVRARYDDQTTWDQHVQRRAEERRQGSNPGELPGPETRRPARLERFLYMSSRRQAL